MERLTFFERILGRSGGEDYAEQAGEYNRAAERYWRMAPRDAVERWPFIHPSLLAHAAWRAGALLGALAPTPGDVVLDFGCGNGWLSLWLNRCGVQTVSMDVSSTAVALALELFQGDPRARMDLEPQFLAYDGETIPLEDGSIDCVVAVDAFHHLPDWPGALSELCRVMRDGARLGVADVGVGHSQSAPAKFEARNYGVLERDVDVDELVKIAREAGFANTVILPLCPPGAVTFDAALRKKFLKGQREVYPTQPLHDSLSSSAFIIIEKGDEIMDSRHPSLLSHRIGVTPVDMEVSPGGRVDAVLIIENTGDTLWLAHEEHGRSVRPAARLYDGRGRLVEMDWWLTHFDIDVSPGSKCDLGVSAPAPEKSGEYTLEFDLKWGDFWLETLGSSPASMKLTVR